MKKVLIICYYWPPAGGPGVQRWLKFVTYLRDFDIEPVVYIPENPSYPIEDQSLVAEIPPGITILKKPIVEPYAWASLFSKKETKTISSGIIKEDKKQGWLQKMMLYIRGNFFIPDARKFWIKPSVKFIGKYLAENPVDAIITTGPPHSLHLIGLYLKAKMNMPWIADFRDPWTSIGYHNKLKLTKKSQKKHKQLEQKVLDGCDHLITTSPKTKLDFEQLTKTPVTCITNGFEEKNIAVERDKKFTLAHIGSLLEARNPTVLWQVLGEIKQENTDFSKNLCLKLAGKISPTIIETIHAHGLGENLKNLGYVNHQDALNLQHSAQLLLLIEIDSAETEAIIPGKVFEYLAARRPILAIGPKNADFFTIIRSANAGFCFEYSDKAVLKEQILNWYTAFKTMGIKSNQGDISQFSRRNLTEKLAQLITNTLEDR